MDDEIPTTCVKCGHYGMRVLGDLAIRDVGGVIAKAHGYYCEGCGRWNTIFASSESMDRAFDKLSKLKKSRPDYTFHFEKVLNKARNLRQKVEYGSL